MPEAWQTLESAWDMNKARRGGPDFERWRGDRVLTPSQLLKYGKIADQEDRDNIRGWIFSITLLVLGHFLGSNWVKRHLFSEGPLKPPSFHVDPKGQFKAGWEGHLLAEMLFNLQHEQGFDGVRKRLLEGNVEATIGELEAARFLQMHGETFRFVESSGRKGMDYDLEILRPASVIRAEVKTKLEADGVTVEGVYRSLNKARGQLPEDETSLIFVRTGGSFDDEQLLSSMKSFHIASERLLRQSSRIIGTVLLTQKYYYSPDGPSGSFLLSKVVPREGSWFQVIPLSDEEARRNWKYLSVFLGRTLWNADGPAAE